MENKILFLDDEEPAHISFKYAINSLCPDSQVTYCFNKQEVEDAINQDDFDVCFIDQRLSTGQLGSEIAKIIKTKNPNSYIVMATAYGLESAQDAIRARVFSDFLSKSAENNFLALELVMTRYNAFKEEEKKRIQAEENANKLQNENTRLKLEIKQKDRLLLEFDKTVQSSVSADERFESLERSIIGQSKEIHRVKYFIKKYAETDDNVLIVGETGTGKDLVAEAIHRLSKRNDSPFIPINCASIPDELMESELFGHKKGTFTNAIEDRIGKLKEADGGTVFLDEIDRLSLRAQAKILRFLDDKKVVPLGQSEKNGTIVNIRIIAAIKPKTINKIGEQFLEDLYGRLHSLFPVIPLLKERKDDIPLLVNYFIDRIGYNMNQRLYSLNSKQENFSKYILRCGEKKLFRFDADGMELIKSYEWKRNVRELQKFIENIYSIFVENKNKWDDQLVPVDDIKRAFIFHNQKPLTDEDIKILDEKYLPPRSINSTRTINLYGKKYLDAIKVIKMLNHACLKVIESSTDKSVAYYRIEAVKKTMSSEKLEKIRNYIDKGEFDNLAVIGLFCTSKKGKEGMAFEAIYNYFTPEFFDLYDSRANNVLAELGDLAPLREKLDSTLQNQRAKKISTK